MNFFKDLKEEMDKETGELTSDEAGLADDFSEDEFGEFDLSEEDALGMDEEFLAKMEAEEELLKKEEEKEEIVENIKEEVSFAAKEEETETVEEKELPEEGITDSGKTTVISKGTVINGSIISDGSLEVFGTVNGDISCLGKLAITGVVKGRSTAAEVYLNTNRIEGGITSKGAVKVSVGTVVIGDISATSCVIAGAVKGDLDVNGPVVIDSTAVVKGNVTAKGIQINNGAIIDGFYALPYSSVDIDSFFGEEESL